jgi:two-component system alkaline phosphatase synthesis response regulator PhoP
LRVSIVAGEDRHVERLRSQLGELGIDCSRLLDGRSASRVAEQDPDLVLVVLDGSADSPGAEYLAGRDGKGGCPPVIALLPADSLHTLDPALPVDDFVVRPWDAAEVVLRTRRALRRIRGVDRGRSIVCGDLVIDLDNCEVTVGGSLVSLTFKEYELLRFLAANRGRVFSRDALLDEVWGEDYFGGDRTVDVHIRRLRSKIEDSTHAFIDTVRNIGYRFRKDL